MSSFISPAPWDRVDQPEWGKRGLNIQVCVTSGASVCFSAYNRALVSCLFGKQSLKAAELTAYLPPVVKVVYWIPKHAHCIEKNK